MIQLLSIINCLLNVAYGYYVGTIIFKKKPSIKKTWWAFLIFIISFYITLYFFSPLFSIFFKYFMFFLFYKLVFKKSFFQTLSAALIAYTIRVVFEVIFIIFNGDIDNTVYNNPVYTFPKFYLNAIVAACSFISAYLFKGLIEKIDKKFSQIKHKQAVVFGLLYVDIFALILFSEEHIVINFELLADFLMMAVFVFFSFISINHERQMEILHAYYKEIFEYSKLTEKLLMEYKLSQHENKNRLLIIKSMLDGDRIEIGKYIDKIIGEHDNITGNWLLELSVIPIPGVKNFVNYKLMRMKELGAKIELYVSPELETIDASKISMDSLNELYTILGVVLDNMIDAIKENDEKLISIQIYKRENTIYAECANSFNNSVNMEKLYNLGYTTKGAQRGVGLCLVEKIVKHSNVFGAEAEILDNFFVQHVTINLDKKTKKHKK